MSPLPTARRSVVWTSLPDGAVLFSTETEVYYSLNPVGALIWELLPRTLDDVCTEVCARHPDVSPERVHADVSALMTELEDAGLIEWAV